MNYEYNCIGFVSVELIGSHCILCVTKYNSYTNRIRILMQMETQISPNGNTNFLQIELKFLHKLFSGCTGN